MEKGGGAGTNKGCASTTFYPDDHGQKPHIWTKTNVAVWGGGSGQGCNLRAASDPGAQRSHVGMMERKWRAEGQDRGGRDGSQ